MRSELIFKAVAHVPNRYLLVRLLAKGTRKMHKPNTRVEDTTNRWERTRPTWSARSR